MEAYRDFTNWSYESDNQELKVESKVLDNEYFKYSKLTIERPLVDEETGELILKKGKPQPDAKKRDTEIVPWTEDIEEYMEKMFSHMLLTHGLTRRRPKSVMKSHSHVSSTST